MIRCRACSGDVMHLEWMEWCNLNMMHSKEALSYVSDNEIYIMSYCGYDLKRILMILFAPG